MSGYGHGGVSPTHRPTARMRLLAALDLLVPGHRVRVMQAQPTASHVTASHETGCWEGAADELIAALQAATCARGGALRRDELVAVLAPWAKVVVPLTPRQRRAARQDGTRV